MICSIFVADARVMALTSKLYAKNSESADVKESQSAAETREGRTEGVRPFSQRILVLIVILAPVVMPVGISLSLAYSGTDITKNV